MAHRFKVETRPALNKDGSISKTKKIHRIIDRTRGRRRIIDEVTTKRDAQSTINIEREGLINAHLDRHPNDLAFKRKHGLA